MSQALPEGIPRVPVLAQRGVRVLASMETGSWRPSAPRQPDPTIPRGAGEFAGGYCDKTKDNVLGDCELGLMGSFPLPKSTWGTSGEGIIQECHRQCARCARCRFLSVSLQWKDCSWYRFCPKLQHDVTGFRTYRINRANLSAIAGAATRVKRRKPFAASSVARQALRLPTLAADPDLAWPWHEPRAALSVALLMHGKMGTLEQPSSWLPTDGATDASALRLAADSMFRFVLGANPAARCTIFIHSWNPSLGPIFDRLYRPWLAWSRHVPELRGISKVHSQSLSLREALLAKQQHEREARRGAKFDLVVAMRHDVLFHAPLHWGQLPRAQLYLPGHCCRPDHGSGRVPRKLERAAERLTRECLGDSTGMIADVCTTSRYLRMGNGDADMVGEAEYNYYVNDWLVAGPSATLDSFAVLAEKRPRSAAPPPPPHAFPPHLLPPPPAFLAHRRSPSLAPAERRYVAALAEVGVGGTEWLHFYWAAHVHHALGVAAGEPRTAHRAPGAFLAQSPRPRRIPCTVTAPPAHSVHSAPLRSLPTVRAPQVATGVRPVMEAGVSFSLARIAMSGRYCRTNTSVADKLPPLHGPVWGGMQQRLCPNPGRLLCPYASHRCAAGALVSEPRSLPAIE